MPRRKNPAKWEAHRAVFCVTVTQIRRADRHELRRRETLGRGHVRKSMTDRHGKETEPLTDRRTEETTSRSP